MRHKIDGNSRLPMNPNGTKRFRRRINCWAFLNWITISLNLANGHLLVSREYRTVPKYRSKYLSSVTPRSRKVPRRSKIIIHYLSRVRMLSNAWQIRPKYVPNTFKIHSNISRYLLYLRLHVSCVSHSHNSVVALHTRRSTYIATYSYVLV